MNSWQIEKFFTICNPCVENFKGVFAADELPELQGFEEASIVVNTNTRDECDQYGHWLALYYQGGRIFIRRSSFLPDAALGYFVCCGPLRFCHI
ncbi:hypothetical protein TNCT_452011 [Trichonephila clavata]|uniref:Uncharacterized protein n=1 Tax=Trichonephila clavata TaxID=2740835 RepID=A0A8X6K4Q7_TRICU|nr:hypothetical protein TNCT_452011 [Trichonephila clavata]